MANDVYHYLYGSKELVHFFEEKRFDLSEFPINLVWKKCDEFRYHIQFETRGMDYPLGLVEEILLHFPETFWYAMEEKCVRQAEFKLDVGEVIVTERQVTEAVNDNIIELQLNDVNDRAQEYLFLFESGRLVVEHFLENRSSEIQLDELENQKIKDHLEWLCQQVGKDSWGGCVGTLALEENKICCYIHFNHYRYTFENPIYDDDVVDEEMNYPFTAFYQHLKQLLENKRIRNVL